MIIIIPERKTSFAELGASDPVLATLRALRDQLRRGEITQATYNEEFARLNNFVGVPCQQCLIRLAHSATPDGRMLCAVCGLEARGGS